MSKPMQVITVPGRTIYAVVFNCDGQVWNGAAFEAFVPAALDFPAMGGDPISGHFLAMPAIKAITPEVSVYSFEPGNDLVNAAGNETLKIVAVDGSFDGQHGDKVGEGTWSASCSFGSPSAALTTEQYNAILSAITDLVVLASPPPTVNDLTDPGETCKTIRVPNCDGTGFVAGATVWVSSDAQNKVSVIPEAVVTDANGWTPPICLPADDYWVFWRYGTTSHSELMTWS